LKELILDYQWLFVVRHTAQCCMLRQKRRNMARDAAQDRIQCERNFSDGTQLA